MTKIIPCDQADLQQIFEMISQAEYCNWTENTLRNTLLSQSTIFLKMCDQSERLLGFISCELILDEAEITNVFVHPDERNKKLGNALVCAVIENCKQQGLKRIFLEVHEKNYPAIGLYQKCGFRLTAERREYYGRDKAYIYTLDIGS